MAKYNNSDAFKIQRTLMRFFGAWPEEHSNLFYKVRATLIFIWSAVFCVTMWMEVINDLGDITKLSEILYVMVSVTVYFIKLSCIIYHRRTFITMVHFLEQPIFRSYPDDLDHYMGTVINISTFLGKTYHSLCLCCISMYVFYPILDNKQLPFPFPYDVGNYRYFMYAFQIVGISFCALINSCLDMLNVSFLGIATAQLSILVEKITRSLSEHLDKINGKLSDEIKKKTEAQLKQCVKHHLAIISYIETIEKIFSVGYFGQFVGSAFVICNTLFHFMLIPPTSLQFLLLANYFVVMAAQLFMYCWFGNEVMLKSLSIGDACYMSKWYNYENGVRKYLFLIMERSRRPVKITVANISRLSLEAFAAIIQWSYSYFALLLNLYYKKADVM